MKIFGRDIGRYASLGSTAGDRAKFALFGLLAWPAKPAESLVSKALFRVPHIWLKPAALGGRQVIIKPTDWSQTVIFDEVFLEHNYDLAKLDMEPDVILDCGAHIGLFSLMASSVFPKAKIFAFEPNPKNVALIRQQISRNSLSVELSESPVSNCVSERYFWWGNTHNGRLLQGDEQKFGSRVETVDLPAMIRELKPKKLLLKLDVEGEEEVMWADLISVFPPDCAIYFETHDGQAGFERAEKLLTQNGFAVRQINSRDIYCDGFAMRRA
jgi:FkbM family methyltransferase